MSALTRDQAKALVDRTLKLSKAEAVQVNINSGDERNVRFADNRITTAGSTNDLSVRVFSSFGKRGAVSSGNDISDAGLEQIVRQSEALARLAPENPEAMPLPGPQTYKEVRGWFDSTANVTAAARAQAAGTMIDAAKKAGDLKAAGILIATSGAEAVGNSGGLFAFHPSTAVDFTTTVRTTDGTGSGWAGVNDPDWRKIDFKATTDRAVMKARLSRNPSAIEPGRYTVILEPQAAADLVTLVMGAFDARSADEGRSAFSKAGGGTKVGDKIMDERVSFVSDPTDPGILGTPFDGDGQARERRVWIENGVLKNLVYSRFWAQRKGVPPTGGPASLMVTGGTQSLEEVIASSERAVLVTRFWYIRPVNQRTLLYTGLTRDGTFLIENGKITRSVRNMRFNESPLFMLDKLEAIGRPVRLSDGGGVLMPPLRVRDFHFTSLSDAV
ncbi:MAG: TldD/PmbA family protein [Gemmatimonadaceae bacterium]